LKTFEFETPGLKHMVKMLTLLVAVYRTECNPLSTKLQLKANYTN